MLQGKPLVLATYQVHRHHQKHKRGNCSAVARPACVWIIPRRRPIPGLVASVVLLIVNVLYCNTLLYRTLAPSSVYYYARPMALRRLAIKYGWVV